MTSEEMFGFSAELDAIGAHDRAEIMHTMATDMRAIEQGLTALPKGLFSGTDTERAEKRKLIVEADRIHDQCMSTIEAWLPPFDATEPFDG